MVSPCLRGSPADARDAVEVGRRQPLKMFVLDSAATMSDICPLSSRRQQEFLGSMRPCSGAAA